MLRGSLCILRGIIAGCAVLVALAWTFRASQAHPPRPEGSDHDTAKTHGGTFTSTNEFQFEVAFERDRIHVHAYDRARDPIDLQGVAGTVLVTYDDDRAPVTAALSYVPGSLHATPDRDRTEYHLVDPRNGHHVAEVSFARVADGDATVEIELDNLPSRLETRVEFSETFKLARPHEFFCVRGCVVHPHESGDCPQCGTALRVRRFIYNCTEHRRVTARTAGESCWVDGQELRKIPQGLDKR